MARQRRNPPGGDGRRSPAAEEQKENSEEAQDDGSNGIDGVGAQGNSGGVHGEGNGRGVQADQQRERDGEELGQHGRNIRQNVLPPPPDWSRNNVNLTTANLVPKQGTISGVAPTTQINPRATLISLTELMKKGGQMRNVLVAIIMSITTAEAEATDTVIVRQKQSNRRQTKRYQR